ncbi:hypothetical protein ACPROK_00930 [Glutamicibacter soli]|uniref:hypothetical protein n=1 Tax=Glutamicibacter soli TaxID=453836 RepID=UPI003C7958C9
MNEMNEAVDLPDFSKKKFLHPLDVAEARALYLRGWWFARLNSVPVLVAIGAVVWVATNDLFAALVAPAGSLAIGLLSSRWFIARAWDYIPRKRQLNEGAGRWRVIASVIDAVAILVIAAVVIVSIQTAAPDPGVIAFATGSGIGVALVQATELFAGWKHGAENLETAKRLILLAAVFVATATVGLIGLGTVWGAWTIGTVAMGAVTVVAAQTIFWLASTTLHRGKLA